MRAWMPTTQSLRQYIIPRLARWMRRVGYDEALLSTSRQRGRSRVHTFSCDGVLAHNEKSRRSDGITATILQVAAGGFGTEVASYGGTTEKATKFSCSAGVRVLRRGTDGARIGKVRAGAVTGRYARGSMGENGSRSRVASWLTACRSRNSGGAASSK